MKFWMHRWFWLFMIVFYSVTLLVTFETNNTFSFVFSVLMLGFSCWRFSLEQW